MIGGRPHIPPGTRIIRSNRLIANLLGATALATYREVQRGLGHFTLQSAFYVLANALQLAAILALGFGGWRSPTLFLAVYGLSGVAALLCVLPLSRHGPRLTAAALSSSRMKEVFRFLRPLLVQAVFWFLGVSHFVILSSAATFSLRRRRCRAASYRLASCS